MTIPELLRIKGPRDPYPIDGEAFADDYGHYMTGTFLYGKTLIVVSHNNNRWHMSIKSKTPLGLHRINELRYIFIPDDVKMAHILPPREDRHEDATHVNLWEVDGREDNR